MRGLCFSWVLAVWSVNAVEPPKLQVLELGKAWQKIENPGLFGKEDGGGGKLSQAYFSEKGDDLLLICKAGFPVQWRIEGVVAPPEVVKFQQPKRNLKENLWSVGLNIFFLDAENFTGLQASSVISCEEVGNGGNRMEVAVFVRGNKGSSLVNVEGVKRLEGDVRRIPCGSTDPLKDQPSLVFGGNVMKNVKWHSVRGFRREDGGRFKGGRYTCRRNREEVVFDVVGEEENARFSPVEGEVRRFADDKMEFRCGSGGKPVKLILEESNATEVTVVKEEERLKVKSLRVKEGVRSGVGGRWKGRAVCLEEGDKLIHEWRWEFLQVPKLHLDNLEGEADCLSELTPKFVETVRCKNGMDCGFMEEMCFRNGTSCNFKKQKQFKADTDTRCWVEEWGKGAECVSVPFSHLNGVVRCGVIGMEKRWEFFVGLDYRRYANWEEAPRRELVKIEEWREDEDQPAKGVVCTAAAYLFADSLAFEVEYKNGSRIRIYPEEDHGGDNERKTKVRNILELNVKATLDNARIGKDAVKVTCLAPFWNGTEILKSSRFLGEGKRMAFMRVADDQEAFRLGEEIRGEVEWREETFYIGTRNKRLNCSEDEEDVGVFGNVTWIYREGEGGKQKYVKQVFPEVVLGADYLEFEYVEKKYDGEYKCVVGHFPGQNETLDSPEQFRVLRKYKLEVAAEPLPASTTVFVGITILALVIVGLAIAAFTVFIQKRNMP